MNCRSDDFACERWKDILKALSVGAEPVRLDEAANFMMNEVGAKPGAYLFRETDEICPVCQRGLEIYYCENRTYVLRCSLCDLMAITRAGSPREAGKKVGLKAKPVRHGTWAHLGGDEWCCTQCGEVTHTEGSWEKPTKKFCNECGAKMDGEAE